MAERNDIGERLAAIEASLATAAKYERDRWHKLDNDLQPISMLPEKLTRELGKLQEAFRGEIKAAINEVEQGYASSLAPVLRDVEALKGDVEILKGAAGVFKILKSPFLGGLLGWIATAVIAAIVYLKDHLK